MLMCQYAVMLYCFILCLNALCKGEFIIKRVGALIYIPPHLAAYTYGH